MLFWVRSIVFFLTVLGSLVTASGAAPFVLFDESHTQQFLIGKQGPLDLSELAELYRSNGFTVDSQQKALTGEALAGVDVLILSGPFQPLSVDEVQAIIEFIDAGGGLAVMLHIAPPVRELLHRLEVDFTNGTLRESAQLIDKNPLDFRVSTLADHPILAGLEGFSVYGAWALRGTAPHVVILAETSPKGWVDLDHNNRLSQGDAVQKFGVMVAGELGRGRFVVLGDDALYQNRFLDDANRLLALRMLDWLSFR